jgi:hypothetical protein
MSTLITLLSTLRIATGSLSLLLPSTTLSLFQMSNPGSALVGMRLFGVRDAILGGLLWTADSPAAIRRALIAGAVVDGIDVLGLAYGAWQGDLSGLSADMWGGGAAVLLGLGLYGLRKPGLVGMGMVKK